MFVPWLFFTSLFLRVSSNTINKITGVELTTPFLEAGFTQVDDRDWVTISTRASNFDNNAVILISLPYLGGELYTEGLPIASRLKDITYSAGSVTFSVKVSER
jgi:hypothetical protein